MKRFASFLLLCAAPFLIYFSVENVLILLVEILRPELWDRPEFPLAATGVTDLVTIPVLFMLYRADGRLGRRPPDRSAEAGWRLCLPAAVSFVGIYLAVNLLLDVLGIAWSDEAFQEVSESIGNVSPGLQLLTAGIIGPVMEELLFRGLLLRRTEKMAGPLWAMLLSALLFGLFHGNLTQGLAAFLLGVFLGTAYVCTDSLLVPVLMHAAANSTAVLMGMPAAAEVLDSDLFYLAVPGFAALGLGLFLRMYAEPFRKLREAWRRRAEAAEPWERQGEAAAATAQTAGELRENGNAGEYTDPDENKGDMR